MSSKVANEKVASDINGGQGKQSLVISAPKDVIIAMAYAEELKNNVLSKLS